MKEKVLALLEKKGIKKEKVIFVDAPTINWNPATKEVVEHQEHQSERIEKIQLSSYHAEKMQVPKIFNRVLVHTYEEQFQRLRMKFV